jgi:hypothetical protein
MSFDTAAGTRGGRQPAGFAARLSNKMIAGRVRKGRAKFPRSRSTARRSR